MAGRGRGRGRGRDKIGFGRGQPFPSNDQLNPLAAEKVPAVQVSPYLPLEFYPAQLSTRKEYDDLLQIREQLLMDFQTSNFHLKQEDENLKLFSSGGEKMATGKCPLNFNWDYFPLELRPLAKQKKKNKVNQSKNMMDSVDLSWLDKLEKNENESDDVVAAEEGAPEADEEEGVDTEELADEDFDMDSDYLNPYFDNGEVDPDDNIDDDEDPTY